MPKLALSWPKLDPSWSQVGPRCPQVGPRWPQVGTKLVPAGPKLAQVGPKWGQVGPTLVQLGPKLPPSWHEIGHRLAQDFINAYVPKLHKQHWKMLIFHFFHVPFRPKLAQVSVKWAEVDRS